MIIVVLAVAVPIAVLVVVVPALRRITAGGHAPRLSVLAWLGMSLTVLVSWALVGVAFMWMPHGGPVWFSLKSFIVSTLGSDWPLTLLLHAVGVALIVPLLRFVFFLLTGLVRAHRQRARRHSALRVLGHTPLDAADVVLVDSELPMVYCMAGKPGVIVATTAARDSLDDDQFNAVLMHERAHLTERHHLLVALGHAVGRVSERLWLFRNTDHFVRMLVEMRADDVALQWFDREVVATAIVRLATLGAPEPALGASDGSVVPRILRMSDPPSKRQRVLAGLGSCWCAGLTCILQVAIIGIPAGAMALGNICIYAYL
ncbi:MAG: M56 family metallopeptidase [Pseudonocardia sp.]